jgi:hypothetical protein
MTTKYKTIYLYCVTQLAIYFALGSTPDPLRGGPRGGPLANCNRHSDLRADWPTDSFFCISHKVLSYNAREVQGWTPWTPIYVYRKAETPCVERRYNFFDTMKGLGVHPWHEIVPGSDDPHASRGGPSTEVPLSRSFASYSRGGPRGGPPGPQIRKIPTGPNLRFSEGPPLGPPLEFRLLGSMWTTCGKAPSRCGCYRRASDCYRRPGGRVRCQGSPYRSEVRREPDVSATPE